MNIQGMANFEWFINGYEEVFLTSIRELNENIRSNILMIFNENIHNYKKFIEELQPILDLTFEQKQTMLKHEKYCICCNNYPITQDPFIIYYDILTNKEITYELCGICNKFTNCHKCNNKEIDGPWEKFYFDTSNMTMMCNDCYNKIKNQL